MEENDFRSQDNELLEKIEAYEYKIAQLENQRAVLIQKQLGKPIGVIKQEKKLLRKKDLFEMNWKGDHIEFNKQSFKIGEKIKVTSPEHEDIRGGKLITIPERNRIGYVKGFKKNRSKETIPVFVRAKIDGSPSQFGLNVYKGDIITKFEDSKTSFFDNVIK